MEQPTASGADAEEKAPGKPQPRKKGRGRLVALTAVAVAAVAAFIYWLHARHFEGTDDAQVDADVINVSPRVSGTLTGVYVQDNQHVAAGQLLAMIDPADLHAVERQARAAVAQARANAAIAQHERKRAETLMRSGATTPEELDRRVSAADAAQATLARAEAELAQADLNLGYTRIVAPAAGIIGKKSIAVGDRVAPGQQLLAISMIDRVWVTANFRETQIRRMRPGQSAQIHVDALGTNLHGTVESLGGATGARFSVLPPENAAGNYVKVVQRIPVRIRLDPGQPGLERLRPGMSVEPKVRVG